MAPDDLKGVAGWLKCQPSDLTIRRERVAIEFFANHIDSCISSYAGFPKEEQRMRKVLRQLQNGAPSFPIFVEEGDRNMFILEGRHRIVAFYKFGLKEIEVAFVSKVKPAPKPTSGASKRSM